MDLVSIALMIAPVTPYIPPLLAGAVLAATLALLAWRRPVPGSGAFALMMLAVAEWGALSALEFAATGLATKVAWSKLEYIGIVAIPPLWLLFTRAYAGLAALPRPANALLWVIPAVTLGLALTNERHGLIWARITASGPGRPLVYHHGPWFWLAVAYEYPLLLSGSVLLLRSVAHAPRDYRGQAVILLAGLAVPWLGNLAYLLGLIPVLGLDPTPFVFALSGLLFFVGAFRFRLLDLTPVARATLVEGLIDGVLVVDLRGRIVDFNPAAWRLLGGAEGARVGRDVREAFAGSLALLALWDARASTPARTDPPPPRSGGPAGEIPAPADPSAFLEVRIAPLRGRDGRTTGELLVLRDITERKRAEGHALLLEREQMARLRAEEALRVRADVLTTVAHDLKNPLVLVKGLTQLLQRRASGAVPIAGPELVEQLARIDGAATKMTRLINELLDVARLQADQSLTLDRRRTDLVALAHQVVAEYQSSSASHRLGVEETLPELVGLWDLFRLERVLDNLLNNAVKYSPRGGAITVRVRQEGDDAVLEVEDHGLGIPAAALPRLFERFQRAANVGATQGTGLGLVGVRRIVEEHGGRVDIHSQEGQGTTVTIRLPREPGDTP